MLTTAVVHRVERGFRPVAAGDDADAARQQGHRGAGLGPVGDQVGIHAGVEKALFVRSQSALERESCPAVGPSDPRAQDHLAVPVDLADGPLLGMARQVIGRRDHDLVGRAHGVVGSPPSVTRRVGQGQLCAPPRPGCPASLLPVPRRSQLQPVLVGTVSGDTVFVPTFREAQVPSSPPTPPPPLPPPPAPAAIAPAAIPEMRMEGFEEETSG